jgi:glycosyltransferase involved in cell wall biosynthesis
VPLGVSATQLRAGRRLRSRCELPTEVVATPFLLHVGDLHERRNLGVIVEAMFEARRHFGSARRSASSLPASTAVSATRSVRVAARSRARAMPCVQLGPVERAAAAGALSLRDRAGVSIVVRRIRLPLLEAMASGTPVIASRAAAIS